jgi:hypothetical protein
MQGLYNPEQFRACYEGGGKKYPAIFIFSDGVLELSVAASPNYHA